jgi:ribosomal protein S18 acetylase RimI-like enzyme
MSGIGQDTRVDVRPRHPGDDPFIAALSGESFARYAHRPQRAVRAMSSRPGSLTLVAEDAPVLLGFCVVAFYRHRGSFGPLLKPVLAQLDAIAVDPEARRCGVGKALLRRAEQLASQRGALSMSLTTARSNLAARALFERCGYQRTAQLGEVYRQREPALWMSKPLR